MSLSPNATIGHYTIISKTGAGGMGEVYRARDTRLDREVAIKLLPAQVSSDSDRLTRFEQEARATSALNHPNILTVYDIGTHDGSPYIVAELLEGEELRDRLNAGSLPLRKVIKEFFFVAPDGRLMSVEIASGSSFEPGKPKPLFDLAQARTTQGIQYDVSADGQRFLFISRMAEATSSVAVIINLTADLKK